MTLTTTYFGSAEWYALIARAKEPISIEAHENYVKQTSRNHCIIATASGCQKLTVPVAVKHSGKTPITEVIISNHGNWHHLHWQAIATAYGQSPFFDYYADDLLPLFQQHEPTLLEHNLRIMRTMLCLLNIDKEVNLTTEYIQSTPPPHIEIRPYYQTFQRIRGFQPGMSILDLLFNTGPEAILWLTK